MAVLRSIPSKRRGPSYRGRVMIDAVRGVLRVRKWPKKRGTPKAPNQLWWIDWFKQANLLAKYADAASQIRSKEMTKGSGLYPRDVLLMAMRGKLYTWIDQDGWRWYPMAARTDISESLDVLAQTVGSILVRAADLWKAPDAGNIGDVLTYRGVVDAPNWQPSGGGSGFLGGCLINRTTDQVITVNTWTAIAWNAETYDTNDFHDNSINPSRMTVPAGVSRVRLSSNITWEGDVSSVRYYKMQKNGASFPGAPYVKNVPGGADGMFQNIISAVVSVVEDDYFEVLVFHGNSPNLDIDATDWTWASLEIIE